MNAIRREAAVQHGQLSLEGTGLERVGTISRGEGRIFFGGEEETLEGEEVGMDKIVKRGC